MSLAEPRRDAKLDVLKSVFGYEAFRPGQEEAIDLLLAGRHVLTVMPTGSGKSLCFQVPALVLGGLALVVSPLVALMRDQVAALRLAGVAADAIHSGQTREENVAAWHRVAGGKTRLLYLAPERLMTERMIAALRRLPVRLVAVDEAHCISQWGPSFRPEYEALGALRETFPGVPIAALTATADEVTRADIAARLFGNDVATLVQGFDRPNIRLTVEPKGDWKRQLLAFARSHPGRCGIVYCLSRKKTEEAAAFLLENGVPARAYHAGMPREAREASQQAFMSEEPLVMVATIAFGMGIDKPDVRFVFHTDIPGSLEAYYQEIGRAGRDGAPAEAHMLFGLGDIRTRRLFIDAEAAGEDRRRRELQRLDALVGYCEAPSCRRQVLLAYFGEEAEPCGNCDACLQTVARVDRSDDARRAVEAVRATGERYGAAHVIDVLRGHATEKACAAGHDRLPVFGAGAQVPLKEWRSILRQLVAAGFLALDIGGYGGLAVARKGMALLAGGEAFLFRPPPAREERRLRRADAAAAVAEDDAEGAALLVRLRALRLALAKERGVPAYVVFADRSLVDMVARRPQTPAEFAEVHGVGAAKLREFGEAFLGAIRSAGG
ncbi:MAG: DNA helicase RecQ [Alphaproteobacteria bacterium]|nr:DNA helicase RecQ [Alphaproteobacteria bacterium]